MCARKYVERQKTDLGRQARRRSAGKELKVVSSRAFHKSVPVGVHFRDDNTKSENYMASF